MAIIIREPRNPLADALGTLSQQILADAASRKEREFRSAEMEKERAFMASENALIRTEAMARLKEQARSAETLNDRVMAANENIAKLDKEWRIAAAEAQKAGDIVKANAIAENGRAAVIQAEAYAKALDREARRQDRVLSVLEGGLFGVGSGGNTPTQTTTGRVTPRNTLLDKQSAEPESTRQNLTGDLLRIAAGPSSVPQPTSQATPDFGQSPLAAMLTEPSDRVLIPESLREAFDNVDPSGSDVLPPSMTIDEVRKAAARAQEQESFFGLANWIDAGDVSPSAVASNLEELASSKERELSSRAAQMGLLGMYLSATGLGTPKSVK